MLSIYNVLKKHLQEHPYVTFEVLNPDLLKGSYAGSEHLLNGIHYRYWTLRSWLDLATELECRMLMPEASTETTIYIHYEKLASHSFHHDQYEDKHEKYGATSHFAFIKKNEEPAFLFAYKKALDITDFSQKKRILNLGINQGDEFALIQELLSPESFANIEFVGIDYSRSAIASAQKRFNTPNVHFYAEDINQIDTLNLGQFDLIISIGTLQSPNINYKPFLMKLVQQYLTPEGAIILGFPNSRWIDGEMVYGAKMRNYSEPELSLLLNDIDYAKRYLQQKKFSLRIQGKEYLFLSATKQP
ncbi:MAG TPA: methyltransferase domain-containing protein [Helicobacteraceae bacterium]|nr:methyltransferase domain-containing protein [Helicobacteraceae bacterium]